jgi:hypothetical protein
MKVFLGSSTESESSMEEVARWIEQKGHEPLPWDNLGLFRLGNDTFSKLIEISRSVDAAIFIFAEDDKVWYRQDSLAQPRDNVLLEYGLFVGALGERRTIICLRGEPKRPTDVRGIQIVSLNRPHDAKARISEWLKDIRDERERQRLRDKQAQIECQSNIKPGAPPETLRKILEHTKSKTLPIHRLPGRMISAFGYETDGGKDSILWNDPMSFCAPEKTAGEYEKFRGWTKTKRAFTEAEITASAWIKVSEHKTSHQVNFFENGRLIEKHLLIQNESKHWGGAWRLIDGVLRLEIGEYVLDILASADGIHSGVEDFNGQRHSYFKVIQAR